MSKLRAPVWAVVDWQSRPSVARRRTVNFCGVLLTGSESCFSICGPSKADTRSFLRCLSTLSRNIQHEGGPPVLLHLYSALNVDASLPSLLTLTLTHIRCCFLWMIFQPPAEPAASSTQSYVLPTLYKVGCLSGFSIFFFVDPEMKANVQIAKTIHPYT